MENSETSCIYVDGSSNNNVNITKKESTHDRVKALEQSRKILELMGNNINKKGDNITLNNVNLSSCYFCKSLIALNRDNQCKLCSEVFCSRHKVEIDHKCEKLSKDTANYLNAKNQFKLRLRQVKNGTIR